MKRLLRWLWNLCYLGLLGFVFCFAGWASFRYFLQGRTLRVPDLVGREVDEARALLIERGLELEVDPGLASHDPAVGIGRIRLQKPEARATVREGATIRAALSLGPLRLEAPDLSGQPSRAARLEIERLGLEMGEVVTLTLLGRSGVIGQNPLPGTVMKPGQAISLLVAREAGGEKRILPDYVGRELESARFELERHGYRIGSVREETYAGVGANVILRQTPLPGYPLPVGQSVSFVVSRGS